MFATSIGSADGAIVGGRPIYATVAPTDTCFGCEGFSVDFGGAASAQ